MMIYLIRHGESQWNKEGIFQGSSNPPLSSRGLMEASRVAKRFQNRHLKAIYSSHLKRAYDTAKSIAIYHQLMIQKKEGLGERRMGKWEGLKRETIREKYRESFHVWMTNRQEASIPGGESIYDFSKRVLSTFYGIVKKEEAGEILIVTHEGVIKAILSGVFQLPIDGVKYFEQANTAVTILKKRTHHYSLVLLNGQGHLKEDL